MPEAKRRVVITGVGMLTPLGVGTEASWKGLIEGRSGIGRITQYDPSENAVQIAGEIKGFEPTAPVGPFYPHGKNAAPDTHLTQTCHPRDLKKIDRFIQLSLAATYEAYGDSALDHARDQIPADRMGINIGVGIGGLPLIVENAYIMRDKGVKRVSPFFIPSVIANMASGQASIGLNLQGPNLCNVTACASSAHSIGEAFHIIQRGDADVMVAGGAESVVHPLAIGGFASMRALSTRNEDPTRASRPYDQDRDGFVLAEGAGTLILEEYETAKRRKAKIYAEILGYGLSGDAYHMTLPAPEGAGGLRAMVSALKASNVRPEAVDYINTHGTSTPAGDVEEARAIAGLFEKSKSKLLVSSTKSMTGHTLGAAGAVESIITALAIKHSLVPPTINLENLDPECAKLGLDFVPHQARKKDVAIALTNSFGFGGTNACLVLGRAPTA